MRNLSLKACSSGPNPDNSEGLWWLQRSVGWGVGVRNSHVFRGGRWFDREEENFCEGERGKVSLCVCFLSVCVCVSVCVDVCVEVQGVRKGRAYPPYLEYKVRKEKGKEWVGEGGRWTTHFSPLPCVCVCLCVCVYLCVCVSVCVCARARMCAPVSGKIAFLFFLDFFLFFFPPSSSSRFPVGPLLPTPDYFLFQNVKG
eukprot:Sspe_Gene.27219::Locus_11627_Transcript_12_13_Confidence_0.320_Length_1197::g.27219::m.27219